MPTGYTYPVANGTITEFSDFAMSCARAFGALVTMRDDPMDAPIPDEFKPSDYNEKALAKSQARLVELRNMTPEQAVASAAADYAEKLASHEKYEADQWAAETRLDEMIKQVTAWTPPTAEHVGLKDFMLEQLRMSKRGTWRPDPPKNLGGQEWLRAQTESAMRDVEYHAAEQAKEVERTRGRTEWVKALRTSLVPVLAHV